MLIPILQKLELTLDQAKMTNEKAHHLQDCLCGLLQVILIKVGHQVEPQLASNIIEIIIRMFKQHSKVTENGLIAFQGLVVGTGEQMCDIT